MDRPESLKAPILMLAGWFDPFLQTELEDFKRVTSNPLKKVSSESRLIIGPWGHAQSIKLPVTETELPYRAESVLPSIPWFDYQLGISKTLNTPRVRIFVMGEDKWRDEQEWPLARTKYTPFYLGSNEGSNSVFGDGFLQTEIVKSGSKADSYIYNPLDPVPTTGGALLSERAGIKLQNEVEKRSDVLVFSTPPLAQQVEVTGPVKAELYVSTDAPSTDFTAKLVDVHPNGSAYIVSDGILRSDFPAASTKPAKIEIELWPTSNVFLKNHRIRLEISSSNFPKYDRNLNNGERSSTATRSSIARQGLAHSAEYPSLLILPIINSK